MASRASGSDSLKIENFVIHRADELNMADQKQINILKLNLLAAYRLRQSLVRESAQLMTLLDSYFFDCQQICQQRSNKGVVPE